MNDALLLLEDGTTMTTFSATALSTNWLNVSELDLGRGNSLWAEFLVTTAVAGTAGGTVEFQIVVQPVTTLAGMTNAVTGGFGEADDEVFTLAAHGLYTGCPVSFATLTGGTGLTASQVYFAVVLTADTFKLATTLALALAEAPDVAISADLTAATMTTYPVILASSGPLQIPQLTAGTSVRMRINSEVLVGIASGLAQRAQPMGDYLFAKYVESGTISAGKWRVDLKNAVQDVVFHPASPTP